MVKKLLSLALMLTLCIGINAQTFQMGGSFNNAKRNLVRKAAPSRAAGSYDYTYLTSSLEETQPWGLGGGPKAQKGTEYNVAIFIPASQAGNTIGEIKFAIDDEITTDIKAWISSSLPATWSAAEHFADNVTVGTKDYVATATFSTPVTIPAAGCYVGYSFKVPSNTTDKQKHPVGVEQLAKATAGSMYLAANNPTMTWSDLSGSNYQYAAAIAAVITNQNLPGNYAQFDATKLNTAYGMVGKDYKFKTNITNGGGNAINTISYTVKDVATNAVSEEKTITLGNSITTFKSGEVTFNATADSELGTFDKEVTITKINGVANEATESASATYSLMTLANTYTRKIVEEEATATGCGPCARGYAGMKALEEKYPETWIGIAAHITGINYNDPMYCSAYTAVTNRASGVPAAWMNRINSVDPYFGTNNQMLGIVADMEEELAKPAIAGIKATAKWDDAMNVISVSTDVEFGINSENGKFGIAYVLLANGLTGENAKYPSRWYQNDGYYGRSADEPYINEWCTKKNITKTSYGYLVTDMVYDHVAIAAKSVGTGVAGSISTPIVAGETQNHTTTFDVTSGIKNSVGDDLIQDKTKLEVVAMLINQTTGEIVNADKVSITGGQTGISTVGINGKAANEVARYTVDGRLVSAPVKGLNIVKMSDGTTMKVMVK